MKLLTPADSDWSLVFQPANPVRAIVPDVHPHLDEMRKIMRQHGGIGLAAPQVGIPLSFFITELGDRDLRVVINPSIDQLSSATQRPHEGCLSFDGGNTKTFVVRHHWIRASWFGENGERRECVHLYGTAAWVFQHEFDHLLGKTIFQNPLASCPSALATAP